VEFITVKSYKARGKRVSSTKIQDLEWIEPQTDETDEKPELDHVEKSEDESLHQEIIKESDKDQPTDEEPAEKKEDKVRTEEKERQIRLDLDI